MAEVAIFAGPSLDSACAAELLPSATLLPPVRLGDVCAAVLDGFTIIVVIDGLFEQVPTLWHKEILWALSQGCAVYGASSMGALRAAELAPFGMRGVGTIFERFLDGTYTDDDEVTIVHDHDLGYRALSVAMVNIRAAVERATRDGICTAAEGKVLVARSKARHYPERSWPLVLRDAGELGLDPERLGRFRGVVQAPQSDAKAQDAVAVLHRVRDDVAAGTRPAAVPFDFESTYNFEKLLAIVRSERAEESVRRRFGEGSATVRARTGIAHLSLLQFLVQREAQRLGLRPGQTTAHEGTVCQADLDGADPQVVTQVLHLESFRAQLEQRHQRELAMFTEPAHVAASLAASLPDSGQPVAERMRSQESNRLDDGRVVR